MYKKYLKDNLKVKLDEKEFDTKRKYLNYLNDLKEHPEVIVPGEDLVKMMDANEPGVVMEYAIDRCGGDASDIDMDDINVFVQRINNGYYLLKYIDEVKNSK
ncbi:MAG: hypothetical protein VZS44_02755 [Bacilli bacterium]|nr:hypothetical protein [Bacilli bacterium]